MSGEFHKANVAYLNVTKGANYINNPKCVKDSLHKVYWVSLGYSLEILDISDLIGFVIAAIVLTILVIIGVIIIFIKKAQYETDDDLPPEPNMAKDP